MAEVEQLTQQNRRTFIFVCANFVMLAVICAGLGYVTWQSVVLISKVRSDLERAEQSVAQLRQQVRQMDAEVVIAKAMEAVNADVRESIKMAIEQSDMRSSLGNLREKIEHTQTRFERTADALRATHEKLQEIDLEQLAQLLAYEMLKGLGDGFIDAAEARAPAAKGVGGEELSPIQ